jgi:hypothetical protein
MMTNLTISLSKSVFSENKKRLELLNDIVAHHTTLSPGLLMSYTGCSLRDAFYVLVLLFERNLAEGYLWIYHIANPEHAIQRRALSTGLPKVPFAYRDEDGEVTVTDLTEISYTFEFDIKPNIEPVFVSATND